jgi:integrase
MSMTTAAIVAASDTAILRDKIVTGLHTRGKKFFLYFRTKDGKERRPKLGTYPVMSVAQARDVAKGLLLEVAKGCDPMAARMEFRAAPTLADVLARFDVEHLSRRKSGAEVLRMLTACLPADLLASKATTITHDDIYRLHQSKKKAPYAANRLVANLSVLFAKCERWGFRPKGSNPCEGVERFAEKKRKRYMSVVEARAIAERLDARAKSDPASVAFAYLLILTGARRGEVAAARWEWMDGSTLQLPDSKTGAKPVFLPPAAMAILAELPRTSGTITGIKSPRKMWEAVRKEAGCPDLRLHDLRHSFASAALGAGYTLAQIGQLLGHSSTQTTQRYAHLMDSTAQAAVAHTADVITERMGRDSNA